MTFDTAIASVAKDSETETPSIVESTDSETDTSDSNESVIDDSEAEVTYHYGPQHFNGVDEAREVRFHEQEDEVDDHAYSEEGEAEEGEDVMTD